MSQDEHMEANPTIERLRPILGKEPTFSELREIRFAGFQFPRKFEYARSSPEDAQFETKFQVGAKYRIRVSVARPGATLPDFVIFYDTEVTENIRSSI